MDSSFLIIFVTMLIGFLGLAIGLFVGLATLWIRVRNEIAGLRTEMQARVSETELAQARREGEMRILAIIAHGHEAAPRERESASSNASDGEDAKDD